MLPVSPEAYRAAGWTRQTRMESLLLMELFLPLHLQFEPSLSCTPAYCSDRPLGLRVCRILIMTSEPIIAPSYGMRTQCQPRKRCSSWLDYSGSLGSQRLHCCAAWNAGTLFVWNDNLWSVKSPRSLLKQMSSGVKFDLIKDEDLSRDKPDCETDDEGA
jgi:hypothetical protein